MLGAVAKLVAATFNGRPDKSTIHDCVASSLSIRRSPGLALGMGAEHRMRGSAMRQAFVCAEASECGWWGACPQANALPQTDLTSQRGGSVLCQAFVKARKDCRFGLGTEQTVCR